MSALHITVGMSGVEGPELLKGIALVKAAALYGDDVDIWGIAPSRMTHIDYLEGLSLEDRASEVVRGNYTSMLGSWGERFVGLATQWRNDVENDQLTDVQRKELHEAWASTYSDAMGGDEGAAWAGFDELWSLVETQLVDIAVLRGSDDAGLVDSLLRTMLDSTHREETYPLFDHDLVRLIRAGISSGDLSIEWPAEKRARIVGLAAGLLSTLPLFELADVDDMLDIRDELKAPLVRFRSAIMEIAAEVEPAAWEEGFGTEVDLALTREIEPAVLEIEEAVKRNRYLRELCHRSANETLYPPAGSALGLALSGVDGVSQLAAAVGGALVGSGMVAYRAYQDWREERDAIESNHLFFYFRAGELLEERLAP